MIKTRKCFQCDQLTAEWSNKGQDFCDYCMELNKKSDIKEQLEYLRGEIENETISYGEIAELQSLKDHIDKNDTILLEWAGVPEH